MDAEQQKHADFEASPAVALLHELYLNGQIALVEYAQEILAQWEKF